MSTTNNQSIQQINTAALRGTREAHQPDADLSKSITFRFDQFREDYEIRDGHGKCRGFIWRYAVKWVCRVDGDVRCCKTLSEAKELARALLLGN